MGYTADLQDMKTIGINQAEPIKEDAATSQQIKI